MLYKFISEVSIPKYHTEGKVVRHMQAQCYTLSYVVGICKICMWVYPMLEGLYIQCYERIVSTEYHISSAVDVSKLSIIQSEYYPRRGPAGLVYKEKFVWGSGMCNSRKCRASHIGHCHSSYNLHVTTLAMWVLSIVYIHVKHYKLHILVFLTTMLLKEASMWLRDLWFIIIYTKHV